MNATTMRTRYLITLLATLLLGVQNTLGQNTLTIPDLTVMLEQPATLSVELDNKDEVVALQFTLTVPEGISLDATTAKMSDRSNGHNVTMRKTGDNAYTAMVASGQNKAVKGSTGILMTIGFTALSPLKPGDKASLALTNVIISGKDSRNIATGGSGGTITISRIPDLTVKGITCDKQTINPGEQVKVSWQVENIGQLATASGWSEQVSLVSEDGNQRKLIATTRHDAVIAVGATVNRQAEITLPQLIGIDGNIRLQVRVVPDSEAGEPSVAQANNTINGEKTLWLNRLLYCELTPQRIEENGGRSVALKVSRSGSWMNAETFTVSATADSRVAFPSTITIPANQSAAVINVSVTDNTELDDNSTVTMTVTGNDYPESTGSFDIIDNEVPSLTVTAMNDKGKEVSEVQEEGSFIVHVVAEKAPQKDVTLTFSSDLPKRFSYPSQSVLKAGKKEVDIQVTAIDDDLSDIEQVATFTVSALGYGKTEFSLALLDNDAPTLELILMPNIVSEGAGAGAVSGTIRRTSNINKYAAIRLSDNSDGALQYQNTTLNMEKGVEEVYFTMGPTDNGVVDGKRTYTITAAVYSTACRCSATERSDGYVTAELTVLDDDGPTIVITPSVQNVKEGNNATLTISRNAKTTEAITVQLNCDGNHNAQFPATVTIPAGKESVDVSVAFPENNVKGDSKALVFSAISDGFEMGTCIVNVIDQSMPDATVTGLKSDRFDIKVNETVNLTYTVNNTGITDLPDTTDIVVFIGGTAVATQKLGKKVAPGTSLTLNTSVNYFSNTGVLPVCVTVNPYKTVKEISYANNTSNQLQMIVSAPFTVSAFMVGKDDCTPGETVKVEGKIDGSDDAISQAEVEIYYILDGYRLTTKAYTNDNGEFSTDITLMNGLYGSYKCGACYPGEDVTTAMATVNVFGLIIERGANPCFYLKPTEVRTGTVLIHNPAAVALQGVRLTIGTVPDNLTFKGSIPSTIPADGTVELSYVITGEAESEGEEWHEIMMSVECQGKAALQIPVKAYVYPGDPELMVYSNSFHLNIAEGATTPYWINIKNGGKGATGNIHLEIPNAKWISTHCTQYPSLDFDEELGIPVYFTATDDMPLNSEYMTQFHIYGENGGSIAITGRIKVVSEKTGRVLVDAVDEGTFYYDEQPHVVGAFVQIKDPYSNRVVASGYTDDKGLFLSPELPCGSYNCTVSADIHADFTDMVYVEAAEIDTLEAFMPIAPITYTWKAYPTTIEDEYEFRPETEFVAHVPTAVVIIDFANELPKEMEVGDTAVVMATVTNHGLVEAEDVNVWFADHDMFDAEAKVKHFDVIPAGTTQFVPVVVTRKEYAHEVNIREKAGLDCEVSAHKEMFAGFRRRCNYQTHRWDTIQVTNSFPLPVPSIACNLRLPGGILRPFPMRIPGGIPVIPPQRTPKPTKPSKDRAPYWSDITRIPQFEGEEELENCLDDCFEDLPDQLDDWKENLDDLIAAAKRAGKKQISRRALLGSLGPMWNAAKLGWDLGKWIDECLIPAYPPLWEYMHGDGTGYDVNSRVHIVTAANAEYDITEEQLQNIAKSYKMYQLLTTYMDESVSDDVIDSLEQVAVSEGYDALFDQIEQGVGMLAKSIKEAMPGGCTRVRVQFPQTAVFTREAFQGVLTINNTASKPLTDIELKFRIEDADGNDCTALFQIVPTYNLTDVALDTEGKGTIAEGSSGTYDILFIPTKNAAPTESVEYRFTGAITFTNPNTGIPFSATLFPVALTVNPTPDIDVHYFLQRDVLGDDALTETVEPSVPAELSVLLNNKGYGDANNVRFYVKQPQIIENEKGLIIDFQIVSSRLNGEETHGIDVNKEQSIVDFGSIPAHSAAYAQWELTSSLLGHFGDYDVSHSHITGYGNKALSIIDNVSIHELMRSIDTSNDGNNLKGFLVNDIQDANNEPDAIYLSDGAKEDVHTALSAQLTKVDGNVYRLVMTPSVEGWNYKNILTPTGKMTIQKVVRLTDGKQMSTRNFWVTNVTLDDILKPTYENRLHLAVDFDDVKEQTFEITFSPRPDIVLDIAEFSGIPETDYALSDPVRMLTVKFNKPIDPTTFTADDLRLMVQGELQDMSDVKIVRIDDQTYRIDLSTLPVIDGLYVLTVQTFGITDREGYPGESGKSVKWIVFQGEETSVSEFTAISHGKRVYSLSGVLVSPEADQKTIDGLPRGIYIIDGKKYLIK